VKWKSKDGFSAKQTNDGKHVWAQTAGKTVGENPFVAGFSEIGKDTFERKRIKHKE